MKPPFYCPQFEPEVMACRASHLGIDPEKIPNTALPGTITIEGVALTSRYRQAGELGVMGRAVEMMDPAIRSKIDSISCDSKTGFCFTIVTSERRAADDVGNELHRLLLQTVGGHNSINITDRAGRHVGLVRGEWS